MISWNGFRNTSSKLVNLKRDCTLLNLTARSGMVNKNMAKGQRLKAATKKKKKALKATSEVCFTNFWGTSGGVTRALKCCYFFLIFVSFSIFVQAHTALSLSHFLCCCSAVWTIAGTEVAAAAGEGSLELRRRGGNRRGAAPEPH